MRIAEQLGSNARVVMPAKPSAEQASRRQRRPVLWVGFPPARYALAGMTAMPLGWRP